MIVLGEETLRTLADALGGFGRSENIINGKFRVIMEKYWMFGSKKRLHLYHPTKLT